MTRNSFVSSLSAVALLAMSGSAFAQMGTQTNSGNNTLGTNGSASNGMSTTGANGTSMTGQVNANNAQTSKVTADHQIRSSKVIGSTVYDEHNNSIGSVDDILLTSTERTPNVVLSVGGFLGIGNKLVEVPYNKLKVNNEGRIVLPGATKDSLKAMTDYRYNGNA